MTQPEPRTPLRPATLCVHAGEAAGRALVPPIVRSSTFRVDDAVYAARAAGHADRSLCYTRETNPTIEAVEARIARLEGAERTLVFASGQAALHALLMSTLERGQRVVVFRQIYGGTIDLAKVLLPRLGVAHLAIMLVEQVEEAAEPGDDDQDEDNHFATDSHPPLSVTALKGWVIVLFFFHHDCNASLGIKHIERAPAVFATMPCFTRAGIQTIAGAVTSNGAGLFESVYSMVPWQITLQCPTG